MKCDLLVHSAAELITAPAGTTPLLGSDLGRPEIHADAAIACVDGRVAAIGPTAAITARYPEREAAAVLDARGRLVAPGFVDAHTHLPFAGTREMEFEARARGERYEEIAARGGGIRSSVRSLRATGEDDLAATVARRLETLLAQGTTTVEAKSGYGLALEEETKQLRAVRRAAAGSALDVVPTFLGAHEVPDEYRDRRAAYVRLLAEEMIPAVAREGLARFADVFCDRGVFTVEESRTILAAGAAHGLRPKLHADELADVGAASLAAELRAISADHLLHASDAGLRAMAAAGVVAVLLPGTALTLGLPYARARDMVALGLPVALATDFNPGSTMSSSMPLMLTLAVTQMRLTPAEAWMAATANGAAAIGEGERLGRLQPGFQADFCLFDAEDYRHIPYHYGHEHVRTVVKRGRIAFDRGPGWSCS
ncbi:MAG: imidazolonepropionase [Hyphomicrobiales bacterium]